MTKRDIYTGFSTVGAERGQYTVTGIELVKRDLLNEFETRRGERVMRPNFGSDIFDLLMEPLDEITKQDVVSDVRRIVDREPRVELVNINITEIDQVLRVDVVLNFLLLDVTDTLRIEYDRRNQQEL